jgi:allophanate hydrolase subunit 1
MTPKHLMAKVRAKLLLCAEDMSAEELNMFADVIDATSDVLDVHAAAQATIADLVAALRAIKKEARKNKPDPDIIHELAASALALTKARQP